MPGLSIKRFFYDWAAAAQSKSYLIDIFVKKLGVIKAYIIDVNVGEAIIIEKTESRLGRARLGTFRFGEFVVSGVSRTIVRLGEARFGTFRLGEFISDIINPITSPRFGIARLGTFRIGVLGQGLMNKIYNIDVFTRKYDITKTYLTNAILFKRFTKTYINDVMIKRIGTIKLYTNDVILKATGTNPKTYLSDLLLRGMRSKVYLINLILQQSNASKNYISGIIINKRIDKAYTLDILILKKSEGRVIEIFEKDKAIKIKEHDRIIEIGAE